jgi:hypothetical protein
LSPDVFWRLTPWQFGLCLQANQEKQKYDRWLMWNTAALHRIDKLPPLAEVMGDKKPVKGIDERAIKERMKAYQRRVVNGD